jgi:hypothetical protein
MPPITPHGHLPHLATALGALCSAHPEAAIRLERAARLVSQGAVKPVYGIGHLIASESEPGRSYWVQRVNRVLTCECEDFRQRGANCKHGWAVVLFAACERLDAEANDPTIGGNVVPMPERAYADTDRFEVTALGRAATSKTAETGQ